MNDEVMVAGFGGQGILSSGKLLALAAMEAGKEVSWLPSYGPEMRGGTANVTVCVSDAPIGSPYITRPTALLVMNQPSLEKYGPQVQSGGVIIINQTLVPVTFEREDCTVLYIEATDLAAGVGMPRSANIVMFGMYVGFSDIVEKNLCIEVIKQEFARKPQFVPTNVSAFKAGFEKGVSARKGA